LGQQDHHLVRTIADDEMGGRQRPLGGEFLAEERAAAIRVEVADLEGLAGRGEDQAPHIILFPENAFDEAAFLAKVQAVVKKVGYCVVVVSEGIRHADGRWFGLSRRARGIAYSPARVAPAEL
jgi:hypothetical protein